MCKWWSRSEENLIIDPLTDAVSCRWWGTLTQARNLRLLFCSTLPPLQLSFDTRLKKLLGICFFLQAWFSSNCARSSFDDKFKNYLIVPIIGRCFSSIMQEKHMFQGIHKKNIRDFCFMKYIRYGKIRGWNCSFGNLKLWKLGNFELKRSRFEARILQNSHNSAPKKLLKLW